MISVSKIVCILACGFVLGVGLSSEITGAGDEMTTSGSALRIGGQAGAPYHHANHEQGSLQAREQIKEHPGERIGGQAGRPYDDMTHEHGSGLHARARIGGQAGEPSDLIQVK